MITVYFQLLYNNNHEPLYHKPLSLTTFDYHWPPLTTHQSFTNHHIPLASIIQPSIRNNHYQRLSTINHHQPSPSINQPTINQPLSINQPTLSWTITKLHQASPTIINEEPLRCWHRWGGWFCCSPGRPQGSTSGTSPCARRNRVWTLLECLGLDVSNS